LQELVGRFEKAWAEAAPTASLDLDSYLPPPEDPLRRAALHELIKSDLEIRWRRGRGLDLDFYLARFPELGPADGLPAALIYEEFRSRKLYGDKIPLATYQTRFPAQFGQLLQLIQERSSFRAHSEPTLNMAPPSSAPTPASSAPTPVGPPPPPGPPPPAPIPPAPAVAPGDSQILQVVGDYRLLQRIGKGSYGEVWKAEAPGGGEVAVKIISYPLDQAEAQREKEALEHVKRLRHPYLVQTQAWYIIKERLYIVMDLADCTLNERVRQCKEQGLPGLPLDEMLRYVREAAEGLDYLHAERLHHRDVKPANLLLQQGHIKVADFGLARPLQTQVMVVDATVAGTAAYMAPEVWENKVSRHSDQWSLAVTYAELRLARRLFKGTNLLSLGCEICQGLPDLSPLPAAEQQVLHKALAPNPAHRYPNCAQFAEALAEAHRPKPPPGPSRPPRWLGIVERAAFSLATLLLMALLIFGIVRFLQRPPQLSFQPAPAPAPLVAVRPGQTASFQLRVQRLHFKGAVKVFCPKPPPDLTIPEVEVPEGADEVLVTVEVGPQAVPKTYKIDLVAEGPRVRDTTPVELGVIRLPDGCEKDGEKIVRDVGGVPYYKQIARVVKGVRGDVRVKFVLVPQQKDEDCWMNRHDTVPTFYIMQDKVWLGLFRRLKPLHPGTDDRHPALNVSFADAAAFAAQPLKGKLPSLREWDKAAGLYSHRRGKEPYTEGPYKGTWDRWQFWLRASPPGLLGSPAAPGPLLAAWPLVAREERDDLLWAERRVRPDVAVVLSAPRPVGTSASDLSPFDCRDMAGNGVEWTRDVRDDVVHYRGHVFGAEEPLRYGEMVKKEPVGRKNKPLEDGGFRVVIEP
jgi:serine/threonine protein kinase